MSRDTKTKRYVDQQRYQQETHYSGWNEAYQHSQIVSGNPHSVAHAELSAGIGTLTHDEIETLLTASETLLDDHHERHEDGGSDEISVLGLSGLLADSQTPLAHVHDGDTLECDGINSNGGAFAFNATGLITLNQSIVVKGLTVALAAKAAAYTLTTTDHVVICNGTFTISLPTAVGIAGKIYHIKNIGTGVITVDGNGAETIDDQLTQTLNQYDSMMIVSDNTEWWII